MKNEILALLRVVARAILAAAALIALVVALTILYGRSRGITPLGVS